MSHRDVPLDEATEALLRHLTANEQGDLRLEIVRTFSASGLTLAYRSYFSGRHAKTGLTLLRKAARDVRAQDVTDALDRLTEREPKFTRFLMDSWLRMHAGVIAALRAGTELPAGVPDEVVHLAAQALQDEAGLIRALNASRVAAERGQQEAADRLKDAESALAQLQHALEQSEKMLEAERGEWTARQARDEQAWQAEAAAREQQWEARSARLEAASRAAAQEASQARVADAAAHAAALLDLRAAHEATVADLQRRISVVRQEERARHGQERAKVEHLERELHAARTRRPMISGSVPATLEDALVVNYLALSDEAAERLCDIVGLYRALVAQDLTDERLCRASNASAENVADSGLVVVGVEQLLADAAGLGLDRLLSLASVRRDAVLHQLAARVSNSRLDGLV